MNREAGAMSDMSGRSSRALVEEWPIRRESIG